MFFLYCSPLMASSKKPTTHTEVLLHCYVERCCRQQNVYSTGLWRGRGRNFRRLKYRRRNFCIGLFAVRTFLRMELSRYGFFAVRSFGRTKYSLYGTFSIQNSRRRSVFRNFIIICFITYRVSHWTWNKLEV